MVGGGAEVLMGKVGEAGTLVIFDPKGKQRRMPLNRILDDPGANNWWRQLAPEKFKITPANAEEVLLDAEVDAAMTQLAGAVNANEWSIEHPSEKAIEYLEKVIGGLTVGGPCESGGGLTILVECLLQTKILGHLHLNVIWRYVAENAATLPYEYYKLDNRRVTIENGVLLYTNRSNEKEEISTLNPAEQDDFRKNILNISYGGLGEVLPMGLARVLWWILKIRHGAGISNWANLLEKYGFPFPVMFVDSNEEQVDVDAYVATLDKLRNRGVMVIQGDPDRFRFETPESDPSKFEAIVEFCNRQIRKNILGTSGSSGDDQGVGSRAKAQSDKSVRQDIIESSARWIADILTVLCNDILSEHPVYKTMAPAKFVYRVPNEKDEARRENVKWAILNRVPLRRDEAYEAIQLTDPTPEADPVLLIEPVAAPGFPSLFQSRGKATSRILAQAEPESKVLGDWMVGSAEAYGEAYRNAYKPLQEALVSGLESLDWDRKGLGRRFRKQMAATAIPTGELARAYTNNIVHGEMLGRASIDSSRKTISDTIKLAQTSIDDPAKAASRGEAIFDDMSADGLLDNEFMPLDDIGRLFSSAAIISPDEFDASLELGTKWGFFVSDLDSSAAVRRVADALDKAQTQGLSQREFMDGLGQDIISQLGPGRLSTVFRTNMSQGSAVGSFNRIMDSDVQRATSKLVYSNPKDRRSTIFCFHMAGRRFNPKHEIWRVAYIPNNFNERSTIYVEWSDESDSDRPDSEWPMVNGKRLLPPEGFRRNSASQYLKGKFKDMG